MVFTLHRYIFRELFKVFILAAVALTLILSLGSILRPVQEFGVGPRQVVHLMGYFLPITLTFVLPIAALFAGSLVYGRFAGDNELDACRASGISLLTLIYPGMALAIIVAIANLLLSFHVMPAFVQRAEKSLKADAKQIVFRNIERKGYYRPKDGKYLIYADQTDSQNDTLAGVVVVEVKGSAVERVIAAESAKVRFNPHRKFNEVQIILHNTSQIGLSDDSWFSFERMSISKEFPSLMSDNIKFKKIDKMKEIVSNPVIFSPIDKLARHTYAQFTTELLAEDISAKISENTETLYSLLGEPTSIAFTASNCVAKDDKKIELTGDVVIIESNTASRQPLRTLQSTKAWLYLEGDELAPTLTMDIYSPTWQQAVGERGVAAREIIRGLILPQTVTDNFKTENILASIEPDVVSSALRGGSSLKLATLQDNLHRKIRKTLLDIKAEIHSRLVFGIGCISMIMIGIGLGIIKKEGHLLSAFGASCVPAAVLIVCIMMGKNVTKNLGSQAGSGIFLMWLGLIVLSLLAGFLYRKLLKN